MAAGEDEQGAQERGGRHRHNKICAHLRDHDLAALADLGFVGLDDDIEYPTVIAGKKASKNKPLTRPQKQVDPAADGRWRYAAAAGHIGQALVVSQHREHDHRDPSWRQLAPPRPDRFEMRAADRRGT